MVDEKNFTQMSNENKVWDVAIIGSGPAGLTAAIYTTRGAASTLLIGGEMWGGQLMLTTTVENFPGFPEGIQGPDLMALFRKQAERFGAEFIQRNVTSVDFSKKPFELMLEDKRYLTRSVIIATGAEAKWLGVPGEDKLIGRGVSSCAPCDAPFFKGKNVAVVGGGDSAMEEALVLTKYASTVTIIHRRDKFRASAAMQEKVINMHNEGQIKILWDTEVVEMFGGQKLEKVKLKTKIDSYQGKVLKEKGFLGGSGKFLEEKEGFLFWEVAFDGIFVAIGHIPATYIFQGQIELDEKGFVKRFPKDGFQMATSIEGVFVAGDVHDYHYRQAITAAGFGCMAAMDALKYLDKPAPSW